MEVIRSETIQLEFLKRFYWDFQEVIKSNDEINKPNPLFNFLNRTYVDSIMTGKRRLIKKQNDSISFTGLLEEIIESPEIFTRDRYHILFEKSIPAIKKEVDGWFDSYAGVGNEYIDKSFVEIDLEELKIAVKKCEDHIDKRIVHYDKREPEQPLTFKEIDDVVELLIEKMRKYYLLFFKTSIADLLIPNWQTIFEKPWVNNEM